jgi:hypothetical protein
MTAARAKMAETHRERAEFVIHIEQKEYKISEGSLTGTQIRELAKPPIGSDRDLFLEVPGPGDDRKIKDSESVAMKNGLHFYSAPKDINPGV